MMYKIPIYHVHSFWLLFQMAQLSRPGTDRQALIQTFQFKSQNLHEVSKWLPKCSTWHVLFWMFWATICATFWAIFTSGFPFLLQLDQQIGLNTCLEGEQKSNLKKVYCIATQDHIRKKEYVFHGNMDQWDWEGLKIHLVSYFMCYLNIYIGTF